MIKTAAILLLILCMLAGCGQAASVESVTYWDVFDTVTTITGPQAQKSVFPSLHEKLLEYHRLFDIYHTYEGLNNLKTLNDQAGSGPVKVDQAIIDLLTDGKSYYTLTGGKVNIAMGAVLKLWHQARTESLEDPASAYLPDEKALAEASLHTGIDAIVIDEDNQTVWFSDPLLQLDVGAIAKGWVAEQMRRQLPEGFLLNLGGNVCASGPKDPSGTPWVIGIQNPDGGDYLRRLALTGGSIVTSGDYQRTYTVAGKAYHHIIDPQTLQPGTYWRSVSVVCRDSGLADALSTALFLLPQAEGQALLEAVQAEAMWVAADGTVLCSPGFESYILS